MADSDPFKSFTEFWPYYLSQHSRRATRLLHVIGTFLALAAIAVAFLHFQLIWLLLAPIIGYGIAWAAHAFVEKNHPATFTYPLWSLRGDIQMMALWLTGRLETEITKHKLM